MTNDFDLNILKKAVTDGGPVDNGTSEISVSYGV